MNLGISVTTSADGESGDWTSIACAPDPDVINNAILTCCPDPILVNLVPNPCNGNCLGSATVIGDGTGPYNYTWVRNSNSTTILTDNNNAGSSTANNLCAGNYTVTVEDTYNSCVTDIIVTVTQPTPVVGVVVSTTPATCNGAATGAFTVSASGGTPNYS